MPGLMDTQKLRQQYNKGRISHETIWNLCDEVDWQRDEIDRLKRKLSIVEHIAGQVIQMRRTKVIKRAA